VTVLDVKPTDDAPSVRDPLAERMPLGGLERWLDDPLVNEVMVNGAAADRDGKVWVERGGELLCVGRISAEAARGALDRLLAPLGRRVDRLAPVVDARLADGSRVCAVIPPIAVDGLTLTIRRFGPMTRQLSDFCSPPVEQLLRRAVRRGCNIVVSGATSTGKTTLLNALAATVAANERLVVLEDTAELRIEHPHVVRLEARPATAEGAGGVDLAALLRTALRLRPDRLVVGEVRGAEAVVLLHALNTGHHGSLSTVHANDPADALARLAALVLQESPGWPMAAINSHLRRAIDVVVHLERTSEGRRRVARVAEVEASDGLGVTPLVADGALLRSLTRGRR
jgi:pilus assembly protein CpaF